MYLYHYTDIKGLLGIFKNNKFWASEIKYLNDTREFSYALDLIQEIHDEEFADRKNNMALGIGGTLHDLLKTPISGVLGVFIISFSENGDQLSQWRGYCPTGGGFSLGLEMNYLNTLGQSLLPGELHSSGMPDSIYRCLYKHDEQKKLISKTVIPVIKEYYDSHEILTIKQSTNLKRTKYEIFDRIVKQIKLSASQIKHPKFQEEKEWRVIKIIENFNYFKLNFRQGSNSLIPYIELPFSTSEIEKIVIGPSSNQQLVSESLYMLYQSLENENKPRNLFQKWVSLSEVPLVV